MSLNETIKKQKIKKQKQKERKYMRKVVSALVAANSLDYLQKRQWTWSSFIFRVTNEVNNKVSVSSPLMFKILTRNKYKELRTELIYKLTNPETFVSHCNDLYDQRTLKEMKLLLKMKTFSD